MEMDNLNSCIDNLLRSVKRYDRLHNDSCLFLFILAILLCSGVTTFFFAIYGDVQYIYLLFFLLLVCYSATPLLILPIIVKYTILRKLHNFRVLDILYNVKANTILNEATRLKDLILDYAGDEYTKIFNQIVGREGTENQELIDKFIYLNKAIRASTNIRDQIDSSIIYNFNRQSRDYEYQLHKSKREPQFETPKRPIIKRDVQRALLPNSETGEILPKSAPDPSFLQPITTKNNEMEMSDFEGTEEGAQNERNGSDDVETIKPTLDFSNFTKKAGKKTKKKRGKREAEKARIERVKATQKEKEEKRRSETNVYSTKYTAPDWIMRHERNIEIGRLGELIVISYEKERLQKWGMFEYVHRIEHSSKLYGDSLGYDITSFDSDGKRIYIEVKTTTGSEKEEIYFTSNQFEKMKQIDDSFCLYRVFSLNDKNLTCKINIYKSYGEICQQFEFIPDRFKLSQK